MNSLVRSSRFQRIFSASAVRIMFPALLFATTTLVRAAADEPGVVLAPHPKPLRPTHQVPGIDTPIEIDAVLDEVAWTQALNLPLNYETRPGENIQPAVATECLITYDSDQLYIAFRAHDPEPEKIRARLTDRDTAFSDDFVGVALDPFNDERRAFEFFVNPLGVQMDMTMDDVNGNEDTSWDAIWSSAGRITETGYVVELAVPFSSLRFPRTQGPQTWGIDAIRFYPRESRYRIGLNPLDRNVSCYLCQTSKLVGFEAITPGRNLEINPTVTASRHDEREDFPSSPLVAGDAESDVGLTVSWGITPNLHLSGTINPDFSQVEADAGQLDVNNQFALFFPERRPFFLEGADLFDTPMNAVFTRNVADPSWGLKLTGKEGRHALGVFLADDEQTNLIFPGAQGSDAESFEFATRDAVVRYRRDIGSSSTIGALLTLRDGDLYSNRVVGVDGLLRFGDSDSVRVQALRSTTRYPGEVAAEFDQPLGDLSDHALRIAYDHHARDWLWYARYDDIGKDFRADMGFMPRVDYSFALGGLERTWWGDESDWFNRVSVGGDWDMMRDQSGQQLEQEFELFFNASGSRESFFMFRLGTRDRHYDGVDFEEDFAVAFFEMRPAGSVFLSLFAQVGDQVDFDNTQPGEILVLEPAIRLDLGRHLRARLSYDYRRLEVEGGTLFEAALAQMRLTYQFNRRTFLRAILQHTDVDRDTRLYTSDDDVEAKTENLFSQLLFSYKLNPRTVLYLGYSDNYSGDEVIDLTQENRTLFLKIGYAWVL